MKAGDLVRLSAFSDFKGFLIELRALGALREWKVLWFKHPYGDEGPVVESQFAPTVEKIKDNGL